jgi:tetratricopeptide (TPR) repeat protein
MTLERLEISPFPIIAGEIMQNRRTGSLTVVNGSAQHVLYWAQGELVMAATSSAGDTLPSFLAIRGAVPAERATDWLTRDPRQIVADVHESGLLSLSSRQTLLREWLSARFVEIFTLDEGTVAFNDDEALAPEYRVFLPSTPALLVEGVRSITNGLTLRRSLGDLSREIRPSLQSRVAIESLPFTEQELQVAVSLTEPVTIESFLKKLTIPSHVAARTVISLLALGVFEIAPERENAASSDPADTERDLAILAAIGSADQRSLRALAYSRTLDFLDHYQLLDLPHGATHHQIGTAVEERKRQFDPDSYPAAVREAVTLISRGIDEAAEVLNDRTKRAAYDQLLQSRSGESPTSIQQRLARSSLASRNLAKAKELSSQGDYYGAIVLLKQAVNFAPHSVESWHLLGSCQERNPRWRREAAESFQRALAIDPENVEVLISLGDLYRAEGMASRAQSCYSDALEIAPDNPQAARRLKELKGR